jgi:hypothetical protein
MTYEYIAEERFRSIGITDEEFLEWLISNMTYEWYTSIFCDFKPNYNWNEEVEYIQIKDGE